MAEEWPRRPKAAVVLWAVCAACWWGNTSLGADARELYKQGIRAYRAGNVAEATERFRESERIDPSYPFAVFALARLDQEAFGRTHRGYVDAAERFERLARWIDANPPGERDRALYQAHYFQGIHYLRGGEYAKALASLRKFQAAYPDYYSPEIAHNACGVALYYLQRFDEAADAFRKAASAKPDFVEASVNLRAVFSRLILYKEALANARSGNLNDALQRVSLLRRLAPAYVRGRQLEGNILRDLGRIDEALRVYRDILATDPSDPATHDIRLEAAKMLEGKGRLRAALDLLNEDLQWFRDVEPARTQTMHEVVRLVDMLKVRP